MYLQQQGHFTTLGQNLENDRKKTSLFWMSNLLSNPEENASLTWWPGVSTFGYLCACCVLAATFATLMVYCRSTSNLWNNWVVKASSLWLTMRKKSYKISTIKINSEINLIKKRMGLYIAHYKITKIVRAFWLVKNLRFIVPVNS